MCNIRIRKVQKKNHEKSAKEHIFTIDDRNCPFEILHFHMEIQRKGNRNELQLKEFK